MSDVIILTPGKKIKGKDIVLSEKAQKELDDLKEKLNLPDIAEDIRC